MVGLCCPIISITGNKWVSVMKDYCHTENRLVLGYVLPPLHICTCQIGCTAWPLGAGVGTGRDGIKGR